MASIAAWLRLPMSILRKLQLRGAAAM